MNDSTRDTLERIAKILSEGLVSPLNALEAAYHMGRVDGGIEMARLSEESIKSAMLEARPPRTFQ